MAYKDMAALRAARNTALSNSDWAMLPDSPLDEGIKVASELVRQSLRDFPSTLTADKDGKYDLKDVELPVVPV